MWTRNSRGNPEEGCAREESGWGYLGAIIEGLILFFSHVGYNRYNSYVNQIKFTALLLLTVFSQILSAAEPKTVIVYGDSITAGAKLTGAEMSHAWVRQTENNSNGAIKMLNEGKGGRPTNSLTEFDGMLKRRPKPELLVIALGTNDSRDTSGKCTENATNNIKEMIAKARTIYPGLLILIVGPPNMRTFSTDAGAKTPRDANLAALNLAYAELAKQEHCSFISLYGILKESDFVQDGVHPTASGHDELAKKMLPAIMEALQPPSA